MSGRDFSVQILSRGEDMVYRDIEGEVPLQRTYVKGHRLYCDDTSGQGFGPALSLERRKRIFENLCEYFGSHDRETIFVLDIRDKDRIALEGFFEQMRSRGHRVKVEADSAERRSASEDEMWLSWLRAGKTISFGSFEVNSVDDYWRWKTRGSDASGEGKGGPSGGSREPSLEVPKQEGKPAASLLVVSGALVGVALALAILSSLQ